MYVYMYIYIYIYTHICIYTHTHYTHTCIGPLREELHVLRREVARLEALKHLLRRGFGDSYMNYTMCCGSSYCMLIMLYVATNV